MADAGGDEQAGSCMSNEYQFIVVGGGIAGVTCAETLSSQCQEESILLLTATDIIKAVTNFRKVTKTLEEFDVIERPMFDLHAACPNVKVVKGVVNALDSSKKEVTCVDGSVYTYNMLCICAGGVPKVISPNNPFVLGIRDTETVKVFQKRLVDAKRIVVVGNGGIATEIVYEIEGCEVVWSIKDDSITSTFIDVGAAEFFMPNLIQDKSTRQPLKRTKYKVEDDVSTCTDSVKGSALGPDWHQGVNMHGSAQGSHNVHVEYKVEVKQILTPEQFSKSELTASSPPHSQYQQESWQVYIELTNGKVFGCDFVVSATGVIPNIEPFTKNNQFDVSDDGGLLVNDKMQTTVDGVYCAGDLCTAPWTHSELWQQMRLWSQARQMGAYAALSMTAALRGEDISLDFCFEMFAHVTKFFNYKVVLLGRFNAQGLKSEDYHLLVRVTKGEEYVKTVMRDGRMIGAIMIGETDLEETFENLILNQMDLSAYGEELLDPNIDIEDYFD